MKPNPTRFQSCAHRRHGFTRTDLLAVLALLAVVAAGIVVPRTHFRNRATLNVCLSNLHEISRAVLLYAGDHGKQLPGPVAGQTTDEWWWYKEQIKGYASLTGASSTNDVLFACPEDRGYSDAKPFCHNPRFDFGSYVFNGVTLPGAPNIAGWQLSDVNQPQRTLLVMEFAAHAPLSWHRSKIGKANAPFYRDAQSVVGFVDGHVDLIKIYYDGYNAAYTRDPIAGYAYKYSGN